MVVFDEIVGELLMQNNCVVIPSLGGFVANTVAARVDVDKGVITPPTKALSFNKNLTNNDGLLINAWAERKTISYDRASSVVSTEVSRIKVQLERGERVHFQNVGFLYLNSAGKMAFEQDRFFNLLLESYGMGSIQFVPVEEEIVEKEKPTEKERLSVVKGGNTQVNTGKSKPTDVKPKEEKVITSSSKQLAKKKTSTLKKVVRYAAAAALIPIAFYSFWIPMKTDVLQSGVIYTNDFNPFSDQGRSLYIEGLEQEALKIDSIEEKDELAEITSHLTPNTGEVFSYPIDEDVFVSVRFNKPGEKIDKKRPQVSGYHLVVGCFSEKPNAEGMITKLNNLGWQGKIVDQHDGLYRVAAVTSQDKNEILEKRTKIERDGLSSWVLKK